MKNNSKIAVWLDYHKAQFINCDSDNKITHVVSSDYTPKPREEGHGATGTQWGPHSSNNEYKSNQKELGQIKSYFEILEKELMPYEDILLCGPAQAKEEFKNLLSQNKHYAKKRIHIESCNGLTENQKLAFVRDYFSANSK